MGADDPQPLKRPPSGNSSRRQKRHRSADVIPVEDDPASLDVDVVSVDFDDVASSTAGPSDDASQHRTPRASSTASPKCDAIVVGDNDDVPPAPADHCVQACSRRPQFLVKKRPGREGRPDPHSPAQGSALTVLCWNLLAHTFTTNNKKFHCTELNQGKECGEQTKRRYTMATEAILEEAPDVVLLQECSPAFVAREGNMNPKAPQLEMKYIAYCCFGVDGVPAESRQRPGCAVLVKRTSRLEVMDVVFVDGGEQFAGKHYCSIAVLCQTRQRERLWIATLHQSYEAPPHLPPARGGKRNRGLLLKAIRSAMAAADPCPNIVPAGDFNATARPKLDQEFLDVRLIEHCTWLSKEMRRVPLLLQSAAAAAIKGKGSSAVELPTGLNPSWTNPVTIDHFYISRGLSASLQGTGGTPRSPYNPNGTVSWLPSAIQGVSDHIWLKMRIQFTAAPPPLPPEAEDPPRPLIPRAAVLSFGEGAPQGVPWTGWATVIETPTGRPLAVGGELLPEHHPNRGRRIIMLAPKFRMAANEKAIVLGESKSGQSWELDNGKSVLKEHEEKSWVFLDDDGQPMFKPTPPLIILS